MSKYVITLEPDKILFSKIKKLKNEVKDLVGNQLYLEDDSHITLYIANLEEFPIWHKQFDLCAHKIKEEFNPITFSIKEWLIFRNDIITKKDTLVCNIPKPESPSLKIIQTRVVLVTCELP